MIRLLWSGGGGRGSVSRVEEMGEIEEAKGGEGEESRERERER